jgi:DNA repair protein RecO (recombination protein O)
VRVDAQPAFVLHAQAYRETSLLVEAFTSDHGRIGLVARGVRGERGQPLRVLLQPLQPLRIRWSGRGDLMRVEAAEAAGAPIGLQGASLLSAFYLNELLLRLLPRGEAMPTLFWRYAQCLESLASAALCGWELRRFERDLLAELGYALVLETDADDGSPLRPERLYLYDPEQGPRATVAIDRRACSGTALLSLARDQMPDPAGLRELRNLIRGVLRHHLGGRELYSWQLLEQLGTRG